MKVTFLCLPSVANKTIHAKMLKRLSFEDDKKVTGCVHTAKLALETLKFGHQALIK